MRSASDRFFTALTKSHTAVATVEVLDLHGNVVDELTIHEGGVTADRTQAQMRDATVSIADPTGTRIPVDMTSLLSPGTRLRFRRGVRLEDVDLRSQVNSPLRGWGVTEGMMFSVLTDENGALTLGGSATLLLPSDTLYPSNSLYPQ